MSRRGLGAFMALACATTLGRSQSAWAADPRADDSAELTGPAQAAVLSLRTGTENWVAGKLAGQSLHNVFGNGFAGQVDAGLVVLRGLTLFAGWQRAYYDVGPTSPYAFYRHASARADYIMVGARLSSRKRIGVMGAADLGYLDLHSDASDGLGGAASVDIPAFAFRAGGGMGLRATSWAVATLGIYATVAVPTGSYRGSVTASGATQAANGSLGGGAPYVALSPGLWLSGELPF